VFGCKDGSTIVLLSVEMLKGYLQRLNVSKDDDSNIGYWHIVFFR
jgi:hypothetical protein